MILPAKTPGMPIAANDAIHATLVNDPAITQFTPTTPVAQPLSTTPTITAPAGFGALNNSGFGSPSPGGFGSPLGGNSSGFGSPMGGGFGVQPGMTGMNGQLGMGMNLTSASPMNAASDAEVLVKNDAESRHWINSKWRPAMGWLYMATCAFDFIIFPILWSVLQAISKGSVTSQWQPVTLQGAGLYHIAMGAVLGIAAYGRTKEKVSGSA